MEGPDVNGEMIGALGELVEMRFRHDGNRDATSR